MVGWIKKLDEKIDGWLNGQKKCLKKIDGWLDGQEKNKRMVGGIEKWMAGWIETMDGSLDGPEKQNVGWMDIKTDG